MNSKIDISGKADGEIDGVKPHHDQVQDHVRGSSPFRRMIAANIGVIGKPRHGREQGCDDTERNGVKRTEHKIRHAWKNETGDVEKQTQKEKTDREMPATTRPVRKRWRKRKGAPWRCRQFAISKANRR